MIKQVLTHLEVPLICCTLLSQTLVFRSYPDYFFLTVQAILMNPSFPQSENKKISDPLPGRFS